MAFSSLSFAWLIGISTRWVRFHKGVPPVLGWLSIKAPRLRQQDEEIVLRIKGSAPVTAEKYRIEKLRCDTCGLILKGKLPEQAGEEKYQDSAKVSVVMMKYGSGLPFYRLETQQAYQPST